MRRSLSLSAAAAAALCFAALGSTAPASAQTLGVKLGASFANLDIEGDADASRATGFAGGGFLRFGSGRIGLQFELLSVTKGADFAIGDDETIELRLEYVEFPALLHIPLTMGQSFTPYVFGGPTLALEAGCKATSTSFGSADCSDDTPFRRSSTDFGLAAGGGLAFAMGPGAVLVEGRYTWGLSNLNSAGDGVPSVRNRAAYLMAGYMIPLVRGF
jgi:opacity protein-like surface antigen